MFVTLSLQNGLLDRKTYYNINFFIAIDVLFWLRKKTYLNRIHPILHW